MGPRSSAQVQRTKMGAGREGDIVDSGDWGVRNGAFALCATHTKGIDRGLTRMDKHLSGSANVTNKQTDWTSALLLLLLGNKLSMGSYRTE